MKFVFFYHLLCSAPKAYYYRIAAELSSSALHDQVDEKKAAAGAAGAGSGYSRGVLGGGDAKVVPIQALI